MTVEIEAVPLPLPKFAEKNRVHPKVVLDEEAGTVTYDSGKGQPRSAPLPGRGPGAVDEVVRLSWTQSNATTGSQQQSKLLFVGEGTVRWQGRTLPSEVFEKMWPAPLWDALEGSAISSRTVRATSAREADRLVPGAAPITSFARFPLQLLAGLVLVVVLGAVVAGVLAVV